MGRLGAAVSKNSIPQHQEISLFAICTQHVQSSPATCWKQDIFALARHLVVYKSSHPFASSTPSFESNEILQQMMMMMMMVMMMMMMMIEDGGKRKPDKTRRRPFYDGDGQKWSHLSGNHEGQETPTMMEDIYTYLHIIYNILIQCKCISVTRLPLGRRITVPADQLVHWHTRCTMIRNQIKPYIENKKEIFEIDLVDEVWLRLLRVVAIQQVQHSPTLNCGRSWEDCCTHRASARSFRRK